MATIARVGAAPAALQARRTAVRGIPSLPTRVAPSRMVIRRAHSADMDGMDTDLPGAQHHGFHRGHASLHNDKLTSTVAGTYEWQIFYIFVAGTILFFPFFPGFTQISQALYESVGGKML